MNPISLIVERLIESQNISLSNVNFASSSIKYQVRDYINDDYSASSLLENIRLTLMTKDGKKLYISDSGFYEI